MGSDASARKSELVRPTFREASRFWLKLGFISFGGPSGQIAILHEEVVERRRWIDDARFLHALNFCMLLPGPEAQQLATYVGWLLHGVRGGIVAGVLFVAPSVVLLLALSWLYAAHGDIGWIAAAFDGLKPVVLALVIAALARLGSKALRNSALAAVAVLALVAFRFLDAPYPLVVALAGAIGFAGSRAAPKWFAAVAQHGEADGAALETPPASRARTLRIAAICLALWIAPILAAGLALGWDHVLARQGVFFSKTAMVTFGGAYAVLPYVAQHSVETFGWLDARQMIDGLGLAESTPGPLIMVLQFVGYLGGWNAPGELAPWQMGAACAAMTTWVTFAPCFLWVLVGAPYVERLRAVAPLSAALRTITAAVVGVMAHLALWFGAEVVAPAAASGERELDVFSTCVAAAAWWALARRRAPVVAVLAASVALGLAHWALR